LPTIEVPSRRTLTQEPELPAASLTSLGTLRRAGFTASSVRRRVARGDLVPIMTGLYSLPGRMPSPLQDLQLVALRAPNAVFCLLTALRLHGLSGQTPPDIWVAVSNKARAPTSVGVPLRVVRCSAASLTAIKADFYLDGVPCKITSPAKTVADCFKYRTKVGQDVAIEALRMARRLLQVPLDELWRHAESNRVAVVMRPYLQSIG
jgi:predicted transcriptional regulator of viral defense system